MQHSYETWVKKCKGHKHSPQKIHLLLPIIVDKAVVWGGRPNSVCGLSFGRSHGGTITINLKNSQHSYETFVKNVKDMITHLKNIPVASFCCWKHGGGGWEAELCLWTEFWPVPCRTIAIKLKKKQDSYETFVRNVKDMTAHTKIHLPLPMVVGKAVLGGA